MKEALIIIYYVLFAVTLLYGAWFTISGFVGIIRKNRNKFPTSEKKGKYAILIPARNEETVIGNLIGSLKDQNYPKDQYEIYTVVNNCTDNTEETARRAGSRIISCTTPTKTKGDVLKAAFKELKDREDIDAYIVFDADNVAHPDYLSKMNDCYQSGYKVAQGFRDAKNPADNWISGSYAIFYLLQNIFFNHSRMSIGGSSSINGTGFLMDKKMIDEKGFETYSLTEDMEYTGQCALRGEKIAFVEDAITYDEYPTSNRVSWIQRRRWSSGVMQCAGLYSFKLMLHFFKTGEMPSFDMSLMYMGPFMQLQSLVLFLMLIGFRIAGIQLNDIFSYIYATGIVCCSFIYLFGLAVELFALKYKDKSFHNMWAGILLFPVFVLVWVPINVCCAFKKENNWKAIKHDRNIDYSKVLQSQAGVSLKGSMENIQYPKRRTV